MFRLNLKIALRNLWKSRSTSFINVISLAMGLTGFIIILLYINKETSYDKWSPELKKVYKVGVSFKNGSVDETWQTMPYSFVRLIREKAPEIESISGSEGGGSLVKKDQQFFYDVDIIRADSSFFSTYPFTFIIGDISKALQNPNTAIINRKTALKIFGTTAVEGKTISLGTDNKNVLITGVWDERENISHYRADV